MQIYPGSEKKFKSEGRLRSLTIVKFGSVICARPEVNVIERCFVTLVELSILQYFGVAYIFLEFLSS